MSQGPKIIYCRRSICPPPIYMEPRRSVNSDIAPSLYPTTILSDRNTRNFLECHCPLVATNINTYRVNRRYPIAASHFLAPLMVCIRAKEILDTSQTEVTMKMKRIVARFKQDQKGRLQTWWKRTIVRGPRHEWKGIERNQKVTRVLLILVERGVVRLSTTRFQVLANLCLLNCRRSSEKNSTKKRKTTDDLVTLTVLRILEEIRHHQLLFKDLHCHTLHSPKAGDRTNCGKCKYYSGGAGGLRNLRCKSADGAVVVSPFPSNY